MTPNNLDRDVQCRDDVADIVARFYEAVLKDPIIGFLFTDIAKIDLEHHLPLITDFWADSLFGGNSYTGNLLHKHLALHQIVALKPGHFTRWLHLFNHAIDQRYCGVNAQNMKARAEAVAKSISAAISDNKRSNMTLTLNDYESKRVK